MAMVRARSGPPLLNSQQDPMRVREGAAHGSRPLMMRKRPSMQSPTDGDGDGCAIALPVARLGTALCRILEGRRLKGSREVTSASAAAARRTVGRDAGEDGEAQGGEVIEMANDDGPQRELLDPVASARLSTVSSSGAEAIMRVIQAACDSTVDDPAVRKSNL